MDASPSPEADDSPWLEDTHYTASESIVADQEVNRLASRFSDVDTFLPSHVYCADFGCLLQSGYRDGIAAGKEAALQRGFDQGFPMGAQGGQLLGRARGDASAWLNFLTSLSSPSPDTTTLISDYREHIRLLAKIKMEQVIGKDIEAEYHFRVEHDGLKPEQVLELPQNLEDELDNLLVGPQQSSGAAANGTAQQPWAAALQRSDALKARAVALMSSRQQC